MMDIKLLREIATSANAARQNQQLSENLAYLATTEPKLLAAAKEGKSSFTFEGVDAFPADLQDTGTLAKLRALYPEFKFWANEYYPRNLTVSWK